MISRDQASKSDTACRSLVRASLISWISSIVAYSLLEMELAAYSCISLKRNGWGGAFLGVSKAENPCQRVVNCIKGVDRSNSLSQLGVRMERKLGTNGAEPQDDVFHLHLTIPSKLPPRYWIASAGIASSRCSSHRPPLINLQNSA